MIEYFETMLSLAMKGNARGVFFFIAIYAFLMLLYSAIYQLKVSKWPGVVGELDRGVIEKWGHTEGRRSDQMYKASLSYRYSVEGVEYEGSRLSPWYLLASYNARALLQRQMDSIQTTPTGNPMVYYNPKKPSQSYLIKPGIVGGLFTVGGAILPAVLYVLKYHV